MKTFFFTLFFALLGLNVFAQGALMRPFGSEYNDVQEFLSHQTSIRLDASSKEVLVASNDNYEVQHLFRQGRLYKTEVVRFFPDRKNVENAIGSLRHYYGQIGADVMDLNTQKDQVMFAVRLGDELHEVTEVKLGKKGFQLHQVKLDLAACSHDEMNELREDQLITSLLKE